MTFNKGDKYKHYVYKTKRGPSKKHAVRTCTIVQDCEKHVIVDFGNYRESILKASMLIRDEWLERVI